MKNLLEILPGLDEASYYVEITDSTHLTKATPASLSIYSLFALI